MKKIIKGKLYDTEAAPIVGEWDNGIYEDRLRFSSEDLHRKRTGEFFLHGRGGPMTKYAVSLTDNGWAGGEKIIPLTYEAAQKWAEEHLDGDKYQEIFGEIAEDDTVRTVMTISVSASTAELVRRSAAKEGLSISAFIEKLVINNA